MAGLTSSTSVAAARWLVGVIAGVVLCFVLATAFAQHLESSIAGRANEIVGNAMPSVQLLSSSRGDLRQLEHDADRYALGSAEERAVLRDQITTTRQDIAAAVASYRALPFFPNERLLFAAVEDALARLAIELAKLDDLHDPAALAQLHRTFDVVDQAIERVVSFDAAQGERLGLDIERIRGDTRGMVVLLDAFSVALAILAAVLALRQLRRAARAQEAERLGTERRAAELTARAEALGEFAGRVAHDVLSPLSTTALALDLVRHACEHDPNAHRATERGLAALQRVHTLVDGLLAFSRAGGRPEPGVTTEVGPVITDVLDALAEQARRERITIDVAPVPAGRVACSAGVMTSLISNLVRNAIRHMGTTDEREIDIRCLERSGRWRVEVEDTGPGVPADQQRRIFEPHVQLAPGSSGAGIGLGLATVDRLVRAHGGDVGVISPVRRNRGSLFWFEVPAAPIGSGERATVLEESGPGAIAKW